MNKKFILFLFILKCSLFNYIHAQNFYHEEYRPQIHFSPKQHWMNDPNGMIYWKGVYHLFFQYYPGRNVWGPMHWGHATSKDLIHWQQQPIALYPDSIGYIFSGSVVADKMNTSHFGNNKEPLVAIFTQHDPVGEKAKSITIQNQSIAYSTDDGNSWKKYKNNPVIKNPGIADFRDPKVMWYAPEKKWIMTLAVKDHVTFYSSLNLKDWKKESEFGKDEGSHGGVWECPDLFTLNYENKKLWVLTVSVGSGSPNGGSGTQYFVGNFNGNNFIAIDKKIKWIDYGTDDYAGVTWSNTGNRKIFLGWMSNWLYATKVPTENWRSGMTIPRDLKLMKIGESFYLSSMPVKEIDQLKTNIFSLNELALNKPLELSKRIKISFPGQLSFSMTEIKDFEIILSNDKNEKLIIGFDKKNDQYFIDRSNSGNTSFYNGFAGKHIAPRISNSNTMNVKVIIDESSVEMFADDGLSVITDIFFPTQLFNQIKVQSYSSPLLEHFEYAKMKSIWP